MACLQSSFARSVCRYVTTFLIPQLLFLFLFFPNAAASDSVMVAGHEVPVLNETGLPITGVEVKALLERHIPDFQSFTRHSIMGPTEDGVILRWSPEPIWGTTPDGKRSLVPLRSDGRFVRFGIGVFRSHREALLAAGQYLNDIQMVLGSPAYSTEDPGYVAWLNPKSNLPTVFVRDNVFVNIQVAEQLDPAAVIRAIDNDLKNAAEGVTRGEKVEPPVINDVGFPPDMTISAANIGQVPLDVNDPNGRKVCSSVWIAGNDLPNLGPNTPPSKLMEPQITWENAEAVKFVPRGAPGTITVTLKAIAVNDLCVVSDVWTKTVRITTLDEAQPKE